MSKIISNQHKKVDDTKNEIKLLFNKLEKCNIPQESIQILKQVFLLNEKIKNSIIDYAGFLYFIKLKLFIKNNILIEVSFNSAEKWYYTVYDIQENKRIIYRDICFIDENTAIYESMKKIFNL